ncbi:hypothetical protein ACHAQH_008961 [Verticillium albo-atrum]
MLHKEAVATLSGPLNALVNGEMKESREGRAIWLDTDEETFIRFCQFAYTDDYTPARPQLLESSGTHLPEVSVEQKGDPEEDSWEISTATPKNKRAPNKRSELWKAFKTRHYVETRIPMPIQNTEGEDYTGVFLSHAKMFVFADCYRIPALETLALHKLHQELVSFKLFESRIGDIVQLMRYAYDNTAQLDDSPGALRDLVTGYAACQVKVLWTSTDFQNLFVSCGELAGDLFKETLKRMD